MEVDSYPACFGSGLSLGLLDQQNAMKVMYQDFQEETIRSLEASAWLPWIWCALQEASGQAMRWPDHVERPRVGALMDDSPAT